MHPQDERIEDNSDNKDHSPAEERLAQNPNDEADETEYNELYFERSYKALEK